MTAHRCAYVARQVTVKHTYGVWITKAEQDAMVRVLGSCPSQKLPTKASSAIPGRRSSTDAAPGEPQTQAEAHTPARALRRPLEPLPCPPDGRPPRQLLQLCRCPGVTTKGTPMVCKTKPDDPRLRWRRA